MNILLRWWRFNLVGVMGMLLQFVLLAICNRIVPGHYLYATGVALELTLLHNFVWHLRYTWRDQRERNGVWRRLARFHLGNGLISLGGNLALMNLFVGHLRMPVVAANATAISVVNFALSHMWAFAEPRKEICTC